MAVSPEVDLNFVIGYVEHDRCVCARAIGLFLAYIRSPTMYPERAHVLEFRHPAFSYFLRSVSMG